MIRFCHLDIPAFMRSHMPLLTQSTRLLDLVSQIQIQSELPMAHPLYRPSDVSPETTARVQTLPPDLRQDYLSLHLRNYLYDIYYSGELQPLAVEATAPAPVLKNNTVRGIDAEFYAQIHQANQGTGYFDLSWQVVQHQASGSLTVKKDGLTVQIHPDRHLRAADRAARMGDTVAILLPRNRLETGYYIAIGNAGTVAEDGTVLELCLNLSAEGAIAAMKTLTSRFNAQAIPFSFKVLMNPTDYQRYDAGVLQIERVHYQQARPVLEQVYKEVRSHLCPETPLFTKVLAPGLGLAEEPDQASQDFGLHRCQLVAEALLQVHETCDRTPEARLAAINQRFVAEGLSLQQPYLNPNATDIYTPLPCSL